MAALSSKSLPSPTRPAGDRVLLRLKTHSPQTAEDVGKALGITTEAARQQLVQLAGVQLAEFTSEVRGVGRPTQIWRLSSKGETRFPDAHGELSAQILMAAEKTLGVKGLENLIAARGAALREQYRLELSDVEGLGPRVSALAAIRKREGYMAETRKDGTAHVLIEKHCPIHAAASACPGLCGAELNLFREVLGSVTITRVDHILSGARRCSYRIEKAH